MNDILEAAGVGIYGLLGLIALFGVYLVVLTLRRIAQKGFPSNAAADGFLEQVDGHLQAGNFPAAEELCDSPGYWAKAVPQLVLVALQNRERPVRKLRQLLSENFEREILADLEYRTSWISTIVKAAPMLGLLGTVVGMIAAFGKIAGASAQGVDPKLLAEDISFALFTTAAGLAIAIPLVLCGALIHVRMGKLQDAVQAQLGRFLDRLEAARGEGGAP